MKRITLLAFLVPLLAVSCQKLPDSSFSVSTTTVDADEFVYFYNYSTNADRFEWDFGDGYLSNDYEPFHAYSTPGNYIVTLTAVSKKGYSSRSSAIITVVNNPSGSPNARFTVSTATPSDSNGGRGGLFYKQFYRSCLLYMGFWGWDYL